MMAIKLKAFMQNISQNISYKKYKDVAEFRRNNERQTLLVLINEYEKTGLNIDQISSMLVELMGGVSLPDDRDDPENKTGMPYCPSVIYRSACGDVLSIKLTVNGRASVIRDLQAQFIGIMNCAKVHNK